MLKQTKNLGNVKPELSGCFNRNGFQMVINTLDCHPTIDLFASRTNTQLKRFCSFRPDPECQTVDSFTISWTDEIFYAFPPFICIPKVIQKICNVKAYGIIIVPDWPNQPWYGQLLGITIKHFILYPRKDLLLLPKKEMLHPMSKTLHLRAALVSGGSLSPNTTQLTYKT